MPSKRSKQLADDVRRILSETLVTKVKDPVLDARVSFVDVRMSGDLADANVYFSVLGDDEKREAVRESLNKASGFFRRELGHRLHFRITPKLHFIEDRTIAEAFYIDRLINEISHKSSEDNEAENGKSSGDEESE